MVLSKYGMPAYSSSNKLISKLLLQLKTLKMSNLMVFKVLTFIHATKSLSMALELSKFWQEFVAEMSLNVLLILIRISELLMKLLTTSHFQRSNKLLKYKKYNTRTSTIKLIMSNSILYFKVIAPSSLVISKRK